MKLSAVKRPPVHPPGIFPTRIGKGLIRGGLTAISAAPTTTFNSSSIRTMLFTCFGRTKHQQRSYLPARPLRLVVRRYSIFQSLSQVVREPVLPGRPRMLTAAFTSCGPQAQKRPPRRKAYTSAAPIIMAPVFQKLQSSSPQEQYRRRSRRLLSIPTAT